MIIGDLKELEIPREGSIAVEHDRHRPVRRRRGGGEGGARAALRRRRLGGGRAAHQREHRALGQLPAFMVLAMQIGAVGILLDQPILIVGAMVVGPEFGPLAGLCVALVERRAELARRSLAALGGGLPAGDRARLPRDPGRSRWTGVEPGRLRARRPRADRLHLEPRLLLLLRRLRGGHGGDPVADERQVGRADRRADLGDHDPGGVEHRRRRRPTATGTRRVAPPRSSRSTSHDRRWRAC